MTLMDRSEAHVGHAAVSVNDSQRTRALGGARKNVSKTGTSGTNITSNKHGSSSKDERQMLTLFDLHNLCDAGDCEERRWLQCCDSPHTEA